MYVCVCVCRVSYRRRNSAELSESSTFSFCARGLLRCSKQLENAADGFVALFTRTEATKVAPRTSNERNVVQSLTDIFHHTR